MTALDGGLTLGDLYRRYGAAFHDAETLRTTIVFKQRSILWPSPGDGADDGSTVLERIYRADLDHAGERIRTELFSASTSESPHLRLSVVTDAERSYYSVDRVHFGALRRRLHLFDRRRFQRGLDGVALRESATAVHTVRAEGVPVTSLSPRLDAGAFARLLSLTGGDRSGPDESTETLDGYRVGLTRDLDLRLEYSWSLLGFDDVASPSATVRPAPFRVTCAVEIRWFDAGADITIPDTVIEPSLPALSSVDEVWAMAAGRSNPRVRELQLRA